MAFYITYEEAMEDVIYYLKSRSDEYFSERNTTLEACLKDTERLEMVTQEHMRCVNSYGNDRRWSCQDACDVEPGIVDPYMLS